MVVSLKKKLEKQELALGGWVMTGHPASAEIMARSGLDWVCIDLEHTAIDLGITENLIRAIEVGGAAALVRLTNNDENLIKRVMDSGASGIIVPMVKSREDAQNAVDALYYPPRGRRGVGLARAQKYGAGAGFRNYRDWLENEAVCVVQIEHIDAVDNLEDILSVSGVDAYFLGPYDLSASMGLAGQLDHPDVLAAMTRTCEIGKQMNKPSGLHIVEPDKAKLKDSIEQGFTFVAWSIDTRMIDIVCRSGIAIVKGIKS